VKLGILVDGLRTAGGAERHTRALIARAAETGDAVVVATLDDPGDVGGEVLPVPAPRGRPARDRVFASRGVALLREAGCDVVLGFRHCPGVDVYLPHGGLVADAVHAQDAARGRVSRLKLLARSVSGKHRFFAEAEAALLGGTEGPRVICVSRALQARMRTVYPACARRTVVVPNGVDVDHFDPSHAPPASLRAELGLADATVGLLVAWNPRLKGAEAAIRALARPETGEIASACHLVVAGGDLPRDLRTLARRLGVFDRVHALSGFRDPRVVYALADVLVHPTFHDPCSLVCLEALAMGLPVITTPQNGVRELMGHRGGIVLEEAGNAQSVAVALRVLADPALRAQTAEDARLIAEAHPVQTALDRVLDVCRAAAR
jgi:UDP-glucose:(heptosyl)LPS alpha-1,3-glucosyltransferase